MATSELRLSSDVVDRYRETATALWDGDLACTDRVSDEVLAGSYMRFKAQGLLEQLFYEGTPSLTWFMDHFAKAARVEVLAVMRQREGQVEHLGLGWANSRTSPGGVFDKMEVGFGFFREYHGHRELITRATQLMIEFVFRYLHVESIFGTTPEKNPAAIRMAKRIGFTMSEVIPHYTVWLGKPCGVRISSMSRERWQVIKNKGVN